MMTNPVINGRLLRKPGDPGHGPGCFAQDKRVCVASLPSLERADRLTINSFRQGV
jgi:hypothetical protein